MILPRGTLVLTQLDPTLGHEQPGVRPRRHGIVVGWGDVGAFPPTPPPHRREMGVAWRRGIACRQR